MSYRIASLDEIRERHESIWAEHFATYCDVRIAPRKLEVTYKMVRCINYGFAPLVFNTEASLERPWLFARRAMCLHCGHVVSTNQPSWMRKHMRNKHGVDEFPSGFYSDLLKRQ